MKIERIFYLLLIAATGAGAVFNWQRAERLQRENLSLHEELASKTEEAARADSAAQAGKTVSEKLQSQTTELMRLRNEVTQLRPGAKTTAALQAELDRLRQENQKLRGEAASPGDPSQPLPESLAGHNNFPRQSWSFAGYASPEAALVSALWSMKEGNPASYLNSLSQDEQDRMAKVWENKSEQEIAAKHQSDVSSITGMNITDRQTVSPTETDLDVFIEGPQRAEKVRMTLVGGEWKFGGYIK